MGEGPSDTEEDSDPQVASDSEDGFDEQAWLSDGIGPKTHQPIPFGRVIFPCRSTWKQTQEEIEINVPLAEAAQAKNIDCHITSTTLKNGVRGQDRIISSPLCGKCDADQSGWQIFSREGARHSELIYASARWIQVTIIKRHHGHWAHVIKGGT